MEPPDATASISFRSPRPDDGREMWRIARDSGALDLNSPYAYVLAGDHFAATSVVADAGDGALAGFVTAYVPPDEPDVVFVWQVAVDHSHRGEGLGRRLLHEVIERVADDRVRAMAATVTPSNEASRRLFRSVARDRGAEYREDPHFAAQLFPGEGHEPENRLLISPL